MTQTILNPCLSCGACCAFFRASFYWAETDDAPGGTVPAPLTEKLTLFRCAMKGMSGSKPRCVALEGEIGLSVSCAIYDKRASVCRDFEVSWTGGRRNPRCDQARIVWGIAPLEPSATLPFTPMPKAA